MLDRTIRQKGLLHQERVEQLTIQIIGHNSALSPLLLNCAFLNAGRDGGVWIATGVMVHSADVSNDLLLNNSHAGQSLAESYVDALFSYNDQVRFIAGKPDHSVDVTIVLLSGGETPQVSGNAIYCRLTPDGFYIGKEPAQVEEPDGNYLSVALAHLASGVLMQEILKACNCIRSVSVLESTLQARLLLQSPELHGCFDGQSAPFEVRQGGQSVAFSPLERTKADQGYFTIDLASQFPELLDSIQVSQEGKRFREIESYVFSLFGWCQLDEGRITYEPSFTLPKKTALDVTIFGMGALGSWVSVILALSDVPELKMNLVDGDMEVEASNLNRQVLYTQALGEVKVKAAERVLHSIRPDAELHIYPVRVDETLLAFAEQKPRKRYHHPDKLENGNADLQLLMSQMLVHDMRSSLVATCFDNMQARHLVNSVVEAMPLPVMVNAGTNGLTVTADLIRYNTDPSLEARYGSWIATADNSYSCTGEVPVPSCVTSSVIAASLQALWLLTARFAHSTNFYRFTAEHTAFESIAFANAPKS